MKIYKLLTSNKIHHPKTDVDRLYIPKNERKGNDKIWIELKNINYWSTKILYKNSGLDATTSSCTWQNKKGSLAE